MEKGKRRVQEGRRERGHGKRKKSTRIGREKKFEKGTRRKIREKKIIGRLGGGLMQRKTERPTKSKEKKRTALQQNQAIQRQEKGAEESGH